MLLWWPIFFSLRPAATEISGNRLPTRYADDMLLCHGEQRATKPLLDKIVALLERDSEQLQHFWYWLARPPFIQFSSRIFSATFSLHTNFAPSLWYVHLAIKMPSHYTTFEMNNRFYLALFSRLLSHFLQDWYISTYVGAVLKSPMHFKILNGTLKVYLNLTPLPPYPNKSKERTENRSLLSQQRSR